jgi:[lysine-biosynthesis-protein LysW]--L-2-aminoadipate ligase
VEFHGLADAHPDLPVADLIVDHLLDATAGAAS